MLEVRVRSQGVTKVNTVILPWAFAQNAAGQVPEICALEAEAEYDHQNGKRGALPVMWNLNKFQWRMIVLTLLLNFALIVFGSRDPVIALVTLLLGAFLVWQLREPKT